MTPNGDPIEHTEAPIKPKLSTQIGELFGAATMCWANIDQAGEFDSTRCGQYLESALALIEEQLLHAWKRGYLFAISNLDDPGVQADVRAVTEAHKQGEKAATELVAQAAVERQRDSKVDA